MAQSVSMTPSMNTKLIALATTTVVALSGISGSVASAQSSGDAGGPPKNMAQCKKALKLTDKGLDWENKRYAKELAKLTKKRDASTKTAAALTQAIADTDARWAAIEALRNDEANPPSDEQENALVDEYNALIPAYDQNKRDLQEAKDDLEGLEFVFSELKKTHTSNVRSTVKYRKQVANYCKRFKK